MQCESPRCRVCLCRWTGCSLRTRCLWKVFPSFSHAWRDDEWHEWHERLCIPVPAARSGWVAVVGHNMGHFSRLVSAQLGTGPQWIPKSDSHRSWRNHSIDDFETNNRCNFHPSVFSSWLVPWYALQHVCEHETVWTTISHRKQPHRICESQLVLWQISFKHASFLVAMEQWSALSFASLRLPWSCQL